ncbi:hypothetical protein HME9302_00878 [Alteripontixanthobacter maritimus]|uniref:Chitooligosaccharide deacetylase n=1 Tax=Alteripontixanthobacter maritimus TaxID=2161824 RepID=A0A369Q948_9SPHN|nr:polysaccharide deacetylase family protein [Alteripontixanthobacter maritimus]RDC59686.1 hypothetical protein HME9302_00878 [Alteripontixanthobacter maritimus]
MTRPVANFHGIGEPPIAIDADERPYWLSETQYAEAISRLMDSDKAVLFTFDDGNLSDLDIGAPALGDAEAVFFICSNRIGREGYLDREQLQELAAVRNFRIGSHGCDHTSWRTVSGAARKAEIAGSRKQLEVAIQAPVIEAGIPFGAYDRGVLKDIADAGYTAAYSSDGGPRYTMIDADPTRVIPRLSFRGDRDIAAQAHALLESCSIAARLKQEARLRAKVLLKR